MSHTECHTERQNCSSSLVSRHVPWPKKKQDPMSTGSEGDLTGSRIPRIQWYSPYARSKIQRIKQQNNLRNPRSVVSRHPGSTGSRKKCVDKIQDPLDPSTICQSRIQVPSRSRILDSADPGFQIFLGSWHIPVVSYGSQLPFCSIATTTDLWRGDQLHSTSPAR